MSIKQFKERAAAVLKHGSVAAKGPGNRESENRRSGNRTLAVRKTASDSSEDSYAEKFLWILFLPLYFLMVAMLILLLIKLWNKPAGIIWEADYTSDIADGNDNMTADPQRLNVAVLPDYTISAQSPDILIPYPEDNAYDVDFSFFEKLSKNELYKTNRIRPGTTVRIPAGDFCPEGESDIDVAVKVYRKNTNIPISSDITLRTNIKNETN